MVSEFSYSDLCTCFSYFETFIGKVCGLFNIPSLLIYFTKMKQCICFYFFIACSLAYCQTLFAIFYRFIDII